MNIADKLNKIFPIVEKPARYTGGEFGSTLKNPEGKIRFLFAFPDSYEVGMSHLGTQILYSIANARCDTFAERAFLPFPDIQAKMAEAEIPLYSLETYTSAADFDIIGFNLSYEMCYSNVLKMLKMAELPIKSADRAGLPIVMAGGTCAVNPEPMAEFIDLFVVGEGEEVNSEILDLYATFASGSDLIGAMKDGENADSTKTNFDKQAFLSEAAKIPGVYVPSLYFTDYNADGILAKITGKPVTRRIVADMDSVPYIENQIVPFCDIVHDRVTLEVFRGCIHGCRFCQAGMIYRPVREKSAATLLKQAQTLGGDSGYEEIGLCSLSTSDYSELVQLAKILFDEFDGKCVSLSLPSLRADFISPELTKKLQSGRKTGFTLAPEAGTQRLRDVINKNISEEDIISGARNAFSSGVTTLKLYFMIGLPTETDEDLAGIVDLVKKIGDEYYAVPKERRTGALKITVSAAAFVPKPFTPFARIGQAGQEYFEHAQNYLKKSLNMRWCKFNWHDAKLSRLEAAFAIGDRRLCQVLEIANELGAQFDGWHDYFDYKIYETAFEQAGLDLEFYANRPRGWDEILPFSHIDCMIDDSFLKNEYEAALLAKTTPDCDTKCGMCGVQRVCGKRVVGETDVVGASCARPTKSLQFETDMDGKTDEQIGPDGDGKTDVQSTPLQPLQYIRYGVRFSRTGATRFISHLDMQRTIARSLRRAEIAVKLSEGFNPHIVLSFAQAMAVGLETKGDFFEFWAAVDDKGNPIIGEARKGALPLEKTITELLNSVMPNGIKILDCRELRADAPKLMAAVAAASYRIEPNENSEQFFDALGKILATKSYIAKKVKAGKTKEIDIRPLIIDCKLNESGVDILLSLLGARSLSPYLLISEIEAIGGAKCNCRVVRTMLFNEKLKPLSVYLI